MPEVEGLLASIERMPLVAKRPSEATPSTSLAANEVVSMTPKMMERPSTFIWSVMSTSLHLGFDKVGCRVTNKNTSLSSTRLWNGE